VQAIPAAFRLFFVTVSDGFPITTSHHRTGDEQL